ncbi:unnamed protein product [Brassicogethes aeneus]|uniref:Uncharacterized protein n=1 Tax=Brassicogethes aeneus TaxID=1431903 RepID=A0A9P0B895_BRAAE|nr:unnamed protein product [Brassicogethes aeneus]
MADLCFIWGTVSVRRFNVTVVSSVSEGTSGGSVSPVPRHRGQPFASIPEDHALDDDPVKNQNNLLQQKSLSTSSRCASPAPSWDFSLEDSDSVNITNI